MRKTFIILFLSSWVFAATGSVSGTISSDRLGLPGANVSLIGSNLEAVTDSVGNYYLTGIPTGKYLLRVDYIGYETQTKEIYITLYDLDEKDETGSILVDKMGIDVELEESKDILKGNALKNVNFELISSALGLDEVVVSAAKKKQKITDAPATISTLNQVSIRRQVGVSAFTRLVTMLKGVDVSYYGVDGAQINARGFSGMFSTRFKQYNDGLDMAELFSSQLYTSISSPPKESISKIEVVFGPQSSLYGADASTGLLNIIHKDPRTNQDNEVNFTGSTINKYRLGSRIVSKVSDNFSWDIITELSQATEFDYGNTERDENGEYINPVSWIENDPITGTMDTLYLDEDFYGVLDQNKFYFRTNLFYSLENGHVIKFSPMYLKAKGYTMGSMGAYYNKNYENIMFDIQYSTDIHHLRYHFIDQGAESIFREPLAHFTAVTGLPFDEAIERAGTGEIASDSLTWFQNYAGIGHLFDYQFNTEIEFANHRIGIVSGIDYEFLDPTSNRTMFDDNGWDYFRDTLVTDARDVKESRYGAYFQFDTDLNQTINFTGSARYDVHDYFGNFLSPKIAFVKDNVFNGSLKLMIGRGFKAPSLTERWIYSGTKNYITGPGYTLDAIAMGNRKGFTLNNYIDNNFSGTYDEGDSLVYSNTLEPIDLEITNTVELSYVGLLKKNLIFEMAAYISEYENFKTAAMHFATTGPWYFSTNPLDPFPNQGPTLPIPGYPETYVYPPTMIEVVDGDGETIPNYIIAITYTSIPVKTNVWGFETGLKYFSDKFEMNLNYTYFNDSELDGKRDKGKRYRKYLDYFYTQDPELEEYANDGDLAPYSDFFDVYSNTPNHQFNMDLVGNDVFIKDLHIGLQTRWISEFEFKSGWFHATNDGDKNDPPIYRSTQTFYKDNGPVGGGFYSDLNITYVLTENYSIGFSVKNILESQAVSFPLSPKQPRYFVLETGYKF